MHERKPHTQENVEPTRPLSAQAGDTWLLTIGICAVLIVFVALLLTIAITLRG